LNKIIYLLICLMVVMVSCNQPSGTNVRAITGNLNEIQVVIEKKQWRDAIGDSLRSVLQNEYPGLQGNEPFFDLKQIAPADFETGDKSFRNIIRIKTEPGQAGFLLDEKSDSLAEEQKILVISAPNDSILVAGIWQNRKKLLETFQKAENKRVLAEFEASCDQNLSLKIQKMFGFSMTIPKGFIIGKEAPSFLWLVYETQASQGIFIYAQALKDTSQLRQDKILKIRDLVMKKYVPGPVPKSYMATDLEFPAMYSKKGENGHAYIEIRSLWHLDGDLMGGPFVNRSFVLAAKKRIVTVEGYVYSSKNLNRNYMFELETILSTIKFE
jgi:hypothetical protein